MALGRAIAEMKNEGYCYKGAHVLLNQGVIGGKKLGGVGGSASQKQGWGVVQWTRGCAGQGEEDTEQGRIFPNGGIGCCCSPGNTCVASWRVRKTA